MILCDVRLGKHYLVFAYRVPYSAVVVTIYCIDAFTLPRY